MPKPKTDRELITSLAARQMIRRGARASDFEGIGIFKAGSMIRLKGAAPEDRTIGFILSNANVDREGDSIAVDGWDVSAYKTNPVVLWAHQHDQLPVGKALAVGTDASGKNLVAHDQFVPASVYPFGDTVFSMLKSGYLNACSVGFQPQEWSDRDDRGINFHKQSLLEHSVCPVPAHPEALVVARSKGIDVTPLARWVEEALDLEKRTGDGAAQIRKQLERLRVQCDPRGRSVFVALSHLKLPSGTAPAPAAEDQAELQEFQAMKSTLASCGTNLSMAAEAVEALLSTSAPAGSPAADEEATEVELLTTVAENCSAASSALLNVSGQAVSLGATPPKSQRVVLSKAARIESASKLLVIATQLAKRVKVGARHSAADQALLQAAHNHLVALGAVCPAQQPPADDPKEFLMLDDEVVEVDGIRLPQEAVSDAIGRAIAEHLLRLTGRLPD